MSSYFSNTSEFTNQISNMIAQYDIDEEMLEIEYQKKLFSDQFDELVAINIQALEEKPNKDQKIKFSIRKTLKSIRKVKKFRLNQVKTQSIVDKNSFKKDYFNNDYFEIPQYQEYQGEWQQEGMEAQKEELAIPIQQRDFQTYINQQQGMLLQDQQDVIQLVDLSITENIANLNNNSNKLSSSSLSLLSN